MSTQEYYSVAFFLTPIILLLVLIYLIWGVDELRRIRAVLENKKTEIHTEETKAPKVHKL